MSISLKFLRPLFIAAIATVAVAAVAVLGTLLLRAEPSDRVLLSEISHIHGIAVDRRDPSRLFVATHSGLFLASPDGYAVPVSDRRDDYMGFSPHPTDGNVLFASGHPTAGGNMGVIASRDGGLTWEAISAGAEGPVDFHAMDVSRADPNVIYGLYGAVQVSRDSGKTWTVAGAPNADVFDLAASALDRDLVYAATRVGLMVSRDGAVNWESTGPENQPATMVQVGDDGSVYAFVFGSGLLKAPASALGWRSVNASFGERVILHLAIDQTEPGRLFAVTDDGRIIASTDGGETWKNYAN